VGQVSAITNKKGSLEKFSILMYCLFGNLCSIMGYKDEQAIGAKE